MLKHNAIYKQTGLTLIEAMVSIAILAIVASLAAPSMGSILKKNQTRATAKLFYDNLRQAAYSSRARPTQTIIFCSLDQTNRNNCKGLNGQDHFKFGWQWYIENDNVNTANYGLMNGADTLLGRNYEGDINNIGVIASPVMWRNSFFFLAGVPTMFSVSGGNQGARTISSLTFSDDGNINAGNNISKINFQTNGRAVLTEAH